GECFVVESLRLSFELVSAPATTRALCPGIQRTNPAGSDLHDASSDIFGTAVRVQELRNELSWLPPRSKLLGSSHFSMAARTCGQSWSSNAYQAVSRFLPL